MVFKEGQREELPQSALWGTLDLLPSQTAFACMEYDLTSDSKKFEETRTIDAKPEMLNFKATEED